MNELSSTPVIAIVGRPNVGKSTLFNRLTKSRDALVADMPGVTRDRQYGEGVFDKQRFIIIDTGGLSEDDGEMIKGINRQVEVAIQEADILLFMVDARVGLTGQDEVIMTLLRQQTKPMYLVVNKTDGLDSDVVCAEYYSLGIAQLYPISATHNRGLHQLIELVIEDHNKQIVDKIKEPPTREGPRIAVVGRPNVGKSTLVNRLLGEERVLVFDEPGTTRDSIFIPYQRHGKPYVLIDTAGVRRRTKVRDMVEKFSVIKTLRAMEAANVVIYLIDAREGVTDQDLRLLGFVLDAGKALVVAINKWDGLESDHRERVNEEILRQCRFVDFAEFRRISALHGSGVGDLYSAVDAAYVSACKQLSTNAVTKVLQDLVDSHPPPLANGRRIKLRYAHVGGHNPPIIVIHGNQVSSVPASYQRYLENKFRDAFKLKGTPIRIQFKSSDNPFEGRSNPITDRQRKKRKRLIKHHKK